MQNLFRKAVEVYEIDFTLSMRNVATMYGYSHQSIHNRRKEKNGLVFNTFISQQKIYSVEESALVEYSVRNFKTDFPYSI
jgi:hypothetical protein